jgi:predicted peptidase
MEKHVFTVSGQTLPYRLARPTTSDPAARFPLVIVLHGAGERGTDNEKHLRVIVPVFLSAENRARHPAFVLAPQCPPDDKWTGINWQQIPHAPQTPEPTYPTRLLLALIEKLAADLPIDRDRIYLAGVSMGGSGAWDLVTRRPDLFGGALILCGGADAAVGHRAARVPVWCFQGAKDDVVVPSLSRDMIAALKHAGGAPRYTEFPDAGHSIVDFVFRDPAPVAWLFAQRRARP